MRLEYGATSDVGRTRSGNEDSFLVDDSIALFVVADGMGGHRAGEVASATAVSALRAAMSPSQPITNAVSEANRAVYDKAGLDPELLGMGTTMTAVVLSGSEAYIGHVGDSRAYLLRDGRLSRLTHDHSFVEQLVREGQLTREQAAVHPKRSILTRALGIDPSVQVDHYMVRIRPGDRLLICSDGLTGMVPEEEITGILGADDDPQVITDRLVEAANDHGGEDNITAVVVDVIDDGDGPLPQVYLTELPADEHPTAEIVALDPPPVYVDQPTVETEPVTVIPAIADAVARADAAAAALHAAGGGAQDGPFPTPGDDGTAPGAGTPPADVTGVFDPRALQADLAASRGSDPAAPDPPPGDPDLAALDPAPTGPGPERGPDVADQTFPVDTTPAREAPAAASGVPASTSNRPGWILPVAVVLVVVALVVVVVALAG